MSLRLCSSLSSQRSSIQYYEQMSANKSKLISESTPFLPKTTPLKIRLKNVSNIYTKAESLNNSKLSIKSETSSHYIKLPNSFYNDRKNIYQARSRILSEKTLSFQNKPLTISQRKRYESSRTEEVVGKRQKLRSLDKNGELEQNHSKVLLSQRFRDVASNKYKKLILGKEMVRVNKALLQKGIKRTFSQQKIKKWSSPFIGESRAQKLRGNPLVSKQIEPLIPTGPKNQLKVLNLDRLFRMREGKLTNIVPLPVARLSEISARESIIKTVKHQDKIHEAINQYNTLLKIAKMKKTIPKLGVKGMKFTMSPTIQELMGLKLAPTKSLYNPKEYSMLDPSIFMQYCQHFQRAVKQQIHLTRRIISGITRDEQEGLSLSAFALFWQLFISRTAKLQQKINFLTYFFVPAGNQQVQLSLIRIFLEIMCKQLPPIEKLDLKTDILSVDEKSKIFLQALLRVLFGQIIQQENEAINRQELKLILQANPDACDLLIRLLQKGQ